MGAVAPSSPGLDSPNQQFVKREELDADLYRQEHRLFEILKNLWLTRELPRDDPKRAAAMYALFWRICIAVMPTAAAGGAGIVALISIVVALRQTQMLNEQNEFIRDQTETQLLAALGDGQSAAVVRKMALDKLKPLRGKDFTGCNFSGLILATYDFTKCILARCSFNKAVLIDAILVDADLTGAQLQEADLSRANLTGANLSDAIFCLGTDEDEYKPPTLVGTNLTNASLDRTVFNKVDLSKSQGLTQAQVTNGKVVAVDTKWPPHIAIPSEPD